MRIAIVRREPKVAFSMDVYADCLVSELRKIRPDWEIIEISPTPWSKDLDNLWHSGNPMRKYYERFFNHPLAVSKLEADIFHIIDHTNAHVAYWLKKLGKPIIITCHDLVQYIYPEILKNQSRFPALSMAVWQYSARGITLADRIVAVSQNTAKDITNWLHIDPSQISVIPNGVESEFHLLPSIISNEWRSQFSSSPEEICLLNIGSTHQRKNILTILNVVRSIANRGIPVRLWKIGDDFTSAQKQFILSNNLESKITLLGNRDRTDLIRFYNATDVLLAPSLYEGFGLTVLEAMACGTPVITSNVSSLPEVVGEAAILVDPMDTETIVRNILHLRQDLSFQKNFIERGFNRSAEFTWRKNAEQLEKIYQELMVF